MPSHKRVLKAQLDEYLETLASEQRAERTIHDYRWVIEDATKRLEAAGFDALPLKVGREEINFLREEGWASLNPSVRRRQLGVLGTYLEWCGNPIVRKMRIGWPQDERVNVDWLEPWQAVAVLEAAEGISRIVVHLELCMGLRRIEVLRLRVRDVQMGQVQVHGKGRMGGKWRTVPFHRETIAALAYYTQLREREISKARAKDPAVAVPEQMLIYEKGGKLHPYKKTSVDLMVDSVSKSLCTSCRTAES
jgi:integrase/recombinase XerD